MARKKACILRPWRSLSRYLDFRETGCLAGELRGNTLGDRQRQRKEKKQGTSSRQFASFTTGAKSLWRNKPRIWAKGGGAAQKLWMGVTPFGVERRSKEDGGGECRTPVFLLAREL